ncbi:MAG: hypothetical protein K6B28_05610 [Lachnospiraceae bacterium]|nr:hypothetical protein [Lachnospiraceae bacterium]
MKRILKQILCVVLMTVTVAGIIPEDIQAATTKTPAKFKKAKELEFGELYEFRSTERYTFEVEESGRFEFYFDNGPRAFLYDQNGKNIIDFNTTIDMAEFTYHDTSSVFYLKAGRYYLEVRNHSKDGRYDDPRRNDPDSFSVDYESSDESFTEDYDNSNYSYGYANTIKFGEVYRGQLGLDDIADIYMFTLPKDGDITVTLKSSDIPNAEYGLIDAATLRKVKGNLDEDVEDAAEFLAGFAGVSEYTDLFKELGRDPRFLKDGKNSLTQKEKLKKGDYYIVITGSALGGDALQYHSGFYEFKISGLSDKNTNKKK